MTISLAEMACGSSSSSPSEGGQPLPGNPPRPQTEAKEEKAEDAPKKVAEIPRKSPGTDLPPEQPSGYEEVNPLPPPKNRFQAENATIQLQQEGRCVEQRKLDCKPGKHCNPPPPKTIECPKELQLPAATQADAVWQKRDRICWEPEAGACKPGDAGCDKPKARRVVCPDAMQAPDPPALPDDDDGELQE
jgi:hypothetical protein